MANNVYKITELYGSSPDGLEPAITNALSEAHSSLRNLDWFEVTEIRGHLADDGRVADWQVGLKLGFRVERGEG